MAKIRYTKNPRTLLYTVYEGSISFTMDFTYMNRLNHYIMTHYSIYYTEASKGVLEWYNKGLLLPERKDIRVEGMETDNGFFADTYYED